MARRILFGGTAALVALSAVAGCSVGLTVDKAKVEEAITTNLGPKLDATIDKVEYPQDLKGEVGQKVICTMSVGGSSVKVSVVVTAVKGTDVNFDMETVS